MSEYIYKTGGIILDLKSGISYYQDDIADLLEGKDQRIKELEETLEKARQREVIIHQNHRQGYAKDLQEINELQEENQQLKDKLEIKLEELHIAYCGIENVKTKNGNLKAEVKQLKQQLEEQNTRLVQENQQLKEKLKDIKNNYRRQIDSLLIARLNLFKQLKQAPKQLAIEQLEKVKENIKKVPITDYDLSGNFEKMYKQDAIRQIDNQIKELKGEE